MTHSVFKIAIVGSGPSGCYATQFLNKSLPNAEIYVFEKLPVPYGLLRYGIASDHQGSKNVAHQFDRLFKQDNIFLCADVSIGQDLTIEQLKSHFNLVIFATGLQNDKCFNIAVEENCYVIGAGSILKGLNSHPDYVETAKPLGSIINIVGAGNVSMDVIRLLCVEEDHLDNSDIHDSYHKIIRSENIERIDVFSRSNAKEAKFDLSMLKEILALEHVQVSFTDDDQIFADFEAAQAQKKQARINVNIHFNASPVFIKYADHRNQMRVKRRVNTLDDQFKSDCIITAIGFENNETDPCAVKSNSTDEFMFNVGWLSSAGNGTVAANRKMVKVAVTDILQQISIHPEHAMLQPKQPNAQVQQIIQNSISFEQWQRIDEFEKRYKPANRCRRKVTRKNLMLMIASGNQTEIDQQNLTNVA